MEKHELLERKGNAACLVDIRSLLMSTVRAASLPVDECLASEHRECLAVHVLLPESDSAFDLIKL